MKYVWAVIILVLVLIAGFLLFMYSGIYNVAATAPHSPLVEWTLATISDHSIGAHAKGIKEPNLSGYADLDEGFEIAGAGIEPATFGL